MHVRHPEVGGCDLLEAHSNHSSADVFSGLRDDSVMNRHGQGRKITEETEHAAVTAVVQTGSESAVVSARSRRRSSETRTGFSILPKAS